MRITTWNVNGIRAVIRKDGFSWLSDMGVDILCLQEVKARQEQLGSGDGDFKGYQGYWHHADKPGYSGVAVFSKLEPLDVRYGIGKHIFDTEGRVIRLRFPDFLLYNVYFPSGQRGLDRVGFKLDFYRCLLEDLDEQHQKGEKIIITGDFNTAHTEIDLANPKSNQKTSGFLPEERAWIDTYLAHGLIDVYRDKYPDRKQYTWWTYTSGARARNVGWRLDYHLVTKTMIAQVEDVIIHDDIHGSDHCPVSLVVQTKQ